MLTLLVFLSKVGLYVTALMGLGAALHSAAAIVTPRRWLVILGLGLIIAVSLRLALLNAQLAGGLSAAFSPDTFSWIWPANRSQAMAFLAGGGLIAASSLAPLKYLKLPAALLIAAGFGLGGHTQGLDTPGLAPWFVGVHAVRDGFWIVAPFTLFYALAPCQFRCRSRPCANGAFQQNCALVCPAIIRFWYMVGPPTGWIS